ncbi:BrnA antitoxin family protein [Blastomonas fulva]|uniref:BrnA antitoxin family protein n=2 Tax=Sphingomonadaceae TaxID=41297 RepID=UPI003EB9FBD3
MYMPKNLKTEDEPWIDPDDAPEWTEDMFRRAAIWHGDKLIRPADGTLTKPGRPKSDNPKQQVTLRLDSAVLEGFRATGPGWQSRINAELRKALKLDG